MRLSTESDRDEAGAIAVLHAAFDAGITFLDTADAYCWDDSERGHNERLISHALATWTGDRAPVRVATKGGLTRPGGRWEADGRAKHLIEACGQSCRALGVERLDLYQLHAPDPRTPLSTSIRALANLKRDGLIEAIGLCNVTVGQIEQARRITEISSVQVELSIWNDDHLLSGVANYCLANRLQLIAHRPLGGPARRSRTRDRPDARSRRPAARRQPVRGRAGLADGLVGSDHADSRRHPCRDGAVDCPFAPYPADRRGSRAARSAAAGRTGNSASGTEASARLRHAAYRRLQTGEVALVMGLPAAGKSTFARSLVASGYHRLNRDEAGGSLKQLLPALDAAISSGDTRVVLDNTYVSRKSRAQVIQAAATRGLPVRCAWLSTTIEDAQTNAAWRIVSRYGKLPDEQELKAFRADDVAAFLPGVQFRYQRQLEPPDAVRGIFARRCCSLRPPSRSVIRQSGRDHLL